MGDSTEIASVVGTWIAAGIAIIALFGVLPPLLLWRNVRSTRHLALKTVDDPNQKFVSKGFHVWRNVYAFRTVKIPYLLDPPKLIGFTRCAGALPTTPSRTGWIAFLETLQAYRLPLHGGGDLVFKDGETMLPIQKLWILAFGLLGRYDMRLDRGRAIAQEDLTTTRLDHEHLNQGNSSETAASELYGNVGILRSLLFWGSTNPIYFTPYNKQLRGDLAEDNIPLSTLFWLLAGCIPGTGLRVYDLCYDASARHYTSRIDRTSAKDSLFSLSWSEPSVPHVRDKDETKRQNIRRSTSTEDQSTRHLPGHRNVVLHRYRPISDVVTNSQWYSWAEAMGCNFEKVMVLGVVSPWDLDTEEFQAAAEAVSFSPDDNEYNMTSWVRFNESKRWPHRTMQCIWRADLHNLCLGVLTIPITAKNFLLHKSRASFGIKLVTVVRRLESQVALFNAVKQTFNHWPMSKDPIQSKKFQDLLDEVAALPITDQLGKLSFSRRLSEGLARLDDFVLDPGPALSRQTIGILYLSTSSFRKFVYDVASKDASFERSNVVIDVAANSVHVTLAGMEGLLKQEARYRVNFKEVFGAHTIPSDNGALSVSLQHMMLACLQAWTRITWFARTLDSRPLIDFVDSLDEVVHVSTKTQPLLPSRHPLPRLETDAPDLRGSDSDNSSPGVSSQENESSAQLGRQRGSMRLNPGRSRRVQTYKNATKVSRPRRESLSGGQDDIVVERSQSPDSSDNISEQNL
jgi:hypothetical protein